MDQLPNTQTYPKNRRRDAALEFGDEGVKRLDTFDSGAASYQLKVFVKWWPEKGICGILKQAPLKSSDSVAPSLYFCTPQAGSPTKPVQFKQGGGQISVTQVCRTETHVEMEDFKHSRAAPCPCPLGRGAWPLFPWEGSGEGWDVWGLCWAGCCVTELDVV